MVRVRLFGRLRALLGRPEIELEFRGCTLGELIEALSESFGDTIKEELLAEDGRIDYAYAVFRGGERVWEPATPLKDGEEITITSMLAGGK